MIGIVPDKSPKRIGVGVGGWGGGGTGGMKLDVRELHARKLNWDDKIPEDLRNIGFLISKRLMK